jgi:cell division protein FtsI (penicillin-binding protein 3)
VFSQVVGGTLRILGVTPDAPFQSLIIPDQPVQESL